MSDPLLFSLLKAPARPVRVSAPVSCRVRPLSQVGRVAALLAGVGLLAGTAQAQIIDDSTKVRYGAHTTFILREADVFRGDTLGRMIDTTLTRLPQSRYWTYDSTYQQNLGNFGTASRRLLWTPNTQLGARLGRNVFDQYVRDAATIPYYDTRSPYTFFRFIQGNPYEQVFELSYARSIKKAFNVGFAYERFGSNKLMGNAGNTRAGLVEHSNFLFFVRYQSPDDRYHALANFSTARHRAVEQGGVQPQATDTLEGNPNRYDLSQLFDYGRELVRLSNAVNRDDRDRVRLAHTYRLLGRGLTAFHIFDWSRQLNKFTDDRLNPVRGASAFYPALLLSQAATDDRAEFRQLENTVGVMGNSNQVEYRLYGRQRTYSLVTRAAYGQPAVLGEALPERNGTQFFAGGAAAFRYRQFAIETNGEVKVETDINEIEYKLNGIARLGPLSGELLLTQYAPTLTEMEFYGNHYRWGETKDRELFSRPADTLNTSQQLTLQDFKNTQVQQLRVRLAQQLGRHYLEGVGTVANISNLIYYNQQAIPEQRDVAQQLIMLMARYRVNFGRFVWDTQGTYTLGAEDNVEGIRVPKIVGDSRFYYQGFIFKKALLTQVGVQGYFQSRWKAYDYSPSTQQFYLQDHFTIRNTPLVDVFLSGDIKTVSIFLKMAYVNQFLPQSGYFTTPYYVGMPRRVQFGIRWQFFN
ncbi:putative porin [Hymenobacter sediminis]|uniref:putative porin n=1 Tax=Hymenobacter sediminis TaxID=2218621 RepID=UPI00138FE72B|nr:putative porin [Hymenobacter sediminis]